MRKKISVLLLSIAMAFCSLTAANAASDITIEIGGEVQHYDQPPQIIGGRVLVPMRGIFEALGATVQWLGEERAVKASKGDVQIYLRIGSASARVNSENVTFDQPPRIINNRTMVPVRFVSETLGAEVNWDGNAKRVSICTPPESNPGDSTLPDPQKAGTNILSSTTVTVEQAQAWARSRGATQTFINLAPLYWRLAPERGVNPAGAYAQAAKETGFGRFGGVLDESFRNPCGMKTTQGGDNYDPDAHQRFSSWEEGVTAHLDHLALYAGATGYPKEDTPDPRHFAVIKGRAATFEDLGGKWAPSPDYGISIVRDYLATLLAYKSVNGEQEAVLNSQ